MKLSIRTKFLLLLTLSVIALVAVGWYGMGGMQSIKTALNRMYTGDLVPMQMIAEANRAMVGWHRDALNCLLSDNEGEIKKYQQEISEQRNIVFDRIQKLFKINELTGEEKESIKNLQAELEQVSPLWGHVSELLAAGKQGEATKMLRAELLPIMDGMDGRMADFLKLQERQSTAVMNAMGNLYGNKLKRLFIVIGGTLAVCLLINLLTAHTIVLSIHQLIEGVQEIAAGNLDYRLSMQGGGEIAQLAATFNAMAAQRQQAYGALHKANEELETRVEQRTRELASMNEELQKEIAERQQAEEALRESSDKLKLFAYSVMHDLKSPAVGMYGLTTLLQKKYCHVLDEKGQSYCEQIVRASEHVTRLVEMINTFIATKETPITIEEINVQEILHLIRDEFSAVLTSRQVQWFDPGISVEIRADKICLLRVLRNFVDNALKYGGEDLTEIRIEYEQSEDFHILSVSDDGVGIKEEDCDEIFELFQRRTTSTEVSGAGLGLSIAKEIAERHHGKVWLEPQVQKGTTFSISIAKRL